MKHASNRVQIYWVYFMKMPLRTDYVRI